MAAAEGAFVAHGFRLTTMEEVARSAQCSKKTLYKLFGSKDELFQVLLTGFRREAELMTVDSTRPPQEALQTFLAKMAALVFRDSSIVLMRIAVSEAGQIPRPFPVTGAAKPELARLALEDYLATLSRNDGYDMPHPSDAARMLIGMALGAFHHELLTGLEAHVPERALTDRISHSVQIFLRGCRIGPERQRRGESSARACAIGPTRTGGRPSRLLKGSHG
ncbi:TetR/AcrR family transcriptional regulator [Roseomonas chloroacetimidivorans]|uniref:TetR/AcrR family transcriptional regulator n=1 Tax=Roseomonas chloroacetimidivorans TaxID=1766656 RepID=UPI003C7609E9